MNEKHCIGQNVKRVVVAGGHLRQVTVTHAVDLPVDVGRRQHTALCGDPVTLPLLAGVPLGYSAKDPALCSRCRRLVSGESSAPTRADGSR